MNHNTTRKLTELNPQQGDALLVVDVQGDFMPGGALAVPKGDAVIPAINRYLGEFLARGLPVFATRDWHPARHCSFREYGGMWPAHCIAETRGADFAAGLLLPESTVVISKATTSRADAYSGFDTTDLESRLKSSGIRRLFLSGVATEVCVHATAKDALSAGFEAVILTDAISALDEREGRSAVREVASMGAILANWDGVHDSNCTTSALLTDLYQLTMLQGYFDHGMDQTAVFELFVRRLPQHRQFLMAAGLEQALEFLENLRFTTEELAWLDESGQFRPDFVDFLAGLRFTGDVHAMPEGTVFFPEEPIVRVTAPMPEAQLVESRLINLIQFQTLIASKAARCALVAPEKQLVDFGMRRSHGAEAALYAARASYLAGFAGSATVLAGLEYGIPVYGTMAHSFIQAHDTEIDAFEKFAHSNPENVVLLIDTYDTEKGAERAVQLATKLKADGIRIKGVRLDSGDLAEHAFKVRRILDEGGLHDTRIFASSSLDEFKLAEIMKRAAPIDGFGVGTRLDTSADVPYLDCAYKLQEFAGRPRRKKSEGKATWPGRKQVFRRFASGKMTSDVVTLDGDSQDGEPLLRQVMRNGERISSAPSLDEIRRHAATSISQLPESLAALHGNDEYPVEISSAILQLADDVDSESPEIE